ncbi:hypothetical protein D0911_18620 [Zhongshania marina]|uniref:Long-chain fatty acid transport protein n=2 Tax=Zhongshania marina TaxID=2304603 RepID=A0ABX9VYK6_9GAMM|nr:hypothetical protein D0911_18620 [Zhongshania marina]
MLIKCICFINRYCLTLLISSFGYGGMGSYLNGYGATNRALSGAGVAFAEDSMVMAINPAGIIDLKGGGWVIGSVFLSSKQVAYTDKFSGENKSDGGFVFAPGRREAEPDSPGEIDGIFPIVYAAMHSQLDKRNAIGIVLYGNGGVNINYKAFDNQNCPSNTPQSGYFCFGDLGSDIVQIFISPTWSHEINQNLSIGISPELIYQSIEINGFEMFSPISSRPNKISNNGHSESFGYGVKIGGTLKINNKLTAGLTMQSKGYMQKHKEYSGLLAEHGDLDVASYLQYGIAWKMSPLLTFLVDYQRIYFSNINSYANSGQSSGRYGDGDGPGFGWGDLSVIKLGIHYRVNKELSLRAGYSDVHREPINKEEVLNNIITTAVFDQRYNMGGSWIFFNKTNTLDLTINYVPSQKVRGSNPFSGDQYITLSNELFTIDIGWRKTF